MALTDTTGLRLLPNIDIWCHYTENDDPAITEYVTKTDRTVIAIPERSGLSVTANRCLVVGYAPVSVFHEGEKWVNSPDTRFNLKHIS